VFGVPPTILGLRVGLENSPYSKIDSAIQIFFRETMVPIWKSMASIWTYQLLHLEGLPEYSFRFDLSQVKQLAEDAQEVSTRVLAEWNAGLRTRNEARQALGLEEVDGAMGEMIRMPVAAMEIPLDSDTEGMLGAPTQVGEDQHFTEDDDAEEDDEMEDEE